MLRNHQRYRCGAVRGWPQEMVNKDLVMAKLMNRRTEEGWTPSETIKIGFKGNSLPSHIYLMDLRIAVSSKRRPNVPSGHNVQDVGDSVIHQQAAPNKPLCPKYGKNDHANCDFISVSIALLIISHYQGSVRFMREKDEFVRLCHRWSVAIEKQWPLFDLLLIIQSK